jgi:hypothetical protein
MLPYSLKNVDGSDTDNFALFKYGTFYASNARLNYAYELWMDTNATGFSFKTGTNQLYAFVNTLETIEWVYETPMRTASASYTCPLKLLTFSVPYY